MSVCIDCLLLTLDSVVRCANLDDFISKASAVPLPPPLTNSDQVRSALAPFAPKKVIPVVNGKIDLRFLDIPRPAEKEFFKLRESPQYRAFVFLGVSGCGKTSTLFSIARKVFAVYMVCTPPEDGGSPTFGVARDTNFANMARSIDAYFADEKPAVALERSVCRIQVELCARLMLLRKLFQQFPGLSPEQFLLSQLHGGSTFIAHVVDTLASYTPEAVRELLRNLTAWVTKLLNGACFLFLVDEGNLGYNHINLHFVSLVQGHRRGIAAPLIQQLSSNRFDVVVAGTKLSLADDDHVSGGIGKRQGQDAVAYIRNFPAIEQGVRALGAILDLNDVARNLPPLSKESLNSRPRVLSLAVESLSKVRAKVEREHPMVDAPTFKRLCLIEAINFSRHTHADRLFTRLRNALQPASTSERDRIYAGEA